MRIKTKLDGIGWKPRPPMTGAAACACENQYIQTSNGHPHMEAERINQIGNQLQDLSARSVELRRYL